MAATGTPTPNIGLRIPQGTDPASVADINYNSTVIDQKVGPVGNTSLQEQIDSAEEAMAYVVNGNDAPSGGIPSGKYVYVKNNTNGIATGMYITTAAISSGATVQVSSLSACSEGAVNSLNSKIAPVEVTGWAVNPSLNPSNLEGGIYRSGNVVNINILVTLGVAPGNTENVITGLPTSKGNQIIPVLLFGTTVNTRCAKVTGTNLKNEYYGLSAGTLIISGSYIANVS